MRAYATPQEVEKYIFYPYIDKQLLDERDLKSEYPQTWQYLLPYREKLESRYSVKKNKKIWWELDSPRYDYLLQPKIISPHLSIVPRFSFDVKGEFAVVRSLVIYPKKREIENDLLRYFIALLNSSICYRYISKNSDKYGSSYTMLEPKTLLKTPVPDPTTVSSSEMSQLLRLVDKRFLSSGNEAIQLEIEIDHAVSKLYGFTDEECSIYGALGYEN